jgi:hypothetical protein
LRFPVQERKALDVVVGQDEGSAYVLDPERLGGEQYTISVSLISVVVTSTG